MAEKQKCPLCEANVVNLSRHLVLRHNIKNGDHLQSKLARPLTPNKPDLGMDKRLQPINIKEEEGLKSRLVRPLTPVKSVRGNANRLQPIRTHEESNRKNIITTALKLQNEKVARTTIRHIQRMGRLIIGSKEEAVVVNEGIDALLSCLDHQSKLVRDHAIIELENILSNAQFDSEIKTKIRSFLKN